MNTNDYKIIERIGAMLCSPEERLLKKKHLTDENKQKLLALKNIHKGKRCFIVGSAPSLNLLDLTHLNNEYTFTVNRGYMLQSKGLMHSTYHIISDKETFKDKDSCYQNLQNFSNILFCYAGMNKPEINIETYYFDYINPKNFKNEYITFCENLTSPLIMYDSVIHFGIQIAYYMGFTEIYLIGVDLDFAQNKGHAYKETAEETIRQQEHSIKMAQFMLEGIKKCGEFLTLKNVNLINASPKGIVDCIERRNFEEIFSE